MPPVKRKKSTRSAAAVLTGGSLAESVQQCSRLVQTVLTALEGLLAQAKPEEKSELILGTGGIMAQLPKLVQLLEQLAAHSVALSATATPQEELAPTMSAEDWQVLKAWIEEG